MLLPFAATFVGLALAGPTTTTCTRSSSSTCSLTICADYINSCSQTYGGCYPACSGYTTPSFTDPGCPPTTKGPPPFTTTGDPQTSDCFSTVTQTVCTPTSTSPTSSRPECPVTVTQNSCSQEIDPNSPTRSTTTATPPPSSTTCTETLCIDNINSCSQWYGGCFPACPGYTTPSFSDPGCPSVTTSCSSSSKSGSSRDPCEWVCLDYFDQCGNTYGPGCWTSCPGGAVPTYATPYCDVEASATTAA